jgi:integrase
MRKQTAINRIGGRPLVDIFEEYRQEYLKPKLEAQTTETGRKSQRKRLLMLHHLEIRLENQTIETFGPEEAQRYKNIRLKSVAPDTVRKELFFISGVYQWLIQEKLMFDLQNPIRLISMPSPGEERDVIHKKSEQSILRQELDGEYAIAYTLLLETAMRLSELLYIRVEWLDLEEDGVVRLPTDATKTRTARWVPLSSEAIRLLAELTRGRVRGPVFTISYEGMRTKFRRVKKRTGLTHLRLHDCRHTAATRYAKTLPNMLMVQQVTGHKNMQSLKRYVHYNAQDIRKHMG